MAEEEYSSAASFHKPLECNADEDWNGRKRLGCELKLLTAGLPLGDDLADLGQVAWWQNSKHQAANPIQHTSLLWLRRCWH